MATKTNDPATDENGMSTLDCEAIELMASRGMTQTQIAHNLGIHKNTLSNHKLHRGVHVADAIKRGRAKGIEEVGNKLYDMAMNGNIAAAIFFMKNVAGWRDNPPDIEEPLRPVINITTTTDSPITVTEVPSPPLPDNNIDSD